MSESSTERFGEFELNYFHGEIIPGNHHILDMYANMPLEDIPIGAKIGIALATARGLNGDDEFVDDNRPLIWTGQWYEDRGKKKNNISVKSTK